MKIIGKTDEGFLLSATEDELANLIGYGSAYGARSDKIQFAPGLKLKIADTWRRLDNLGHLGQRLMETAKALRGIADALDVFEPVLIEAGNTKPPKEQAE